MRRMMDKMGLDMQEMPNVREVLIRTDKKEIILSKPEVTEMKSKDKSIFTITSDGYEEKELDVPIFSDEDIDLVCQQSGTASMVREMPYRLSLCLSAKLGHKEKAISRHTFDDCYDFASMQNWHQNPL